MLNKSILITGANGGIGIEVVKLLVKEKASRIVLGSRTDEKANRALRQVPASGYTHLEPLGGFDMNHPEKIGAAVAALPQGKKFDIVFLQAGEMVVADDYQFITSGGLQIEKTIFQNAIGAFLTLKFLEEADLLSFNARIVFAGGEGARGIPGLIDKPGFDTEEELQEYVFNGKGDYKPINAIGVSKFAAALLVQKLARQGDGKEYVWFSPGLTAGTNGLTGLPAPRRFIMEKIFFPLAQLLGFAQGPKQAAMKYVASLAGEYGSNGDLIGAPEGKALGTLVDQKPMHAGFTNIRFQDTFWDIVQDYCLKAGFFQNVNTLNT